MSLKPFYQRDAISIYNASAEELLKSLDSDSIDLIVTDPPYFKVKNDWWDNQWKKPETFLAWMGELCDQWQRVLKPNGSLYVFACRNFGRRVIACDIDEAYCEKAAERLRQGVLF